MSDIFGSSGPQPGGGAAALKKMNYGYGPNQPAPSLQSALDKSWLFEVVDKKTGTIKESFTLVMPPTALTIKEPQRVSITKTFGNAFLDDYGPDNIQITLKAISGTAHAFPTFRTAGQSSTFTDVASAIEGAKAAGSNTSGYTGKNAFYEFRDKIMRYKDKSGWEKNELRAYDLADEQAYKCILLDFTLDRTTQTPLRYPFTISLFVYEKMPNPKGGLTSSDAIQVSRDPIAALDDADSFLAAIDSAYQDVQDIVNATALLKAKSLELRTRYNSFLTQTTKVITSPLDVAKNMLDTALTAIGTIYDSYVAGRLTFDRYMQAHELFRATMIQALKTYGFQISQGWQQKNTIEIEQDAGVNADTSTISRNVSLQSYEYSGLQVYTVKGDDTLQRIALNELGDENLWVFIADVNSGIESNYDLVTGTEIFIPVQIDPGTGANKEQFILTEDVARDPFGTDIKIDENGNMVIQENNDFSLVSGVANVQQAVDLKLNTVAGSMIKQSAYGLISSAGQPGVELAIKYVKMSIRTALLQDPRIESIENLLVSFGEHSDTLIISMDIGLIGVETSLPTTVSL